MDKFVILCKDVDGRKFDRYFKSWSNAEKAMLEDIEGCKKVFELTHIKSVSQMNVAKGFYERYEVYKDDSRPNKTFTWSLIDGYFQD